MKNMSLNEFINMMYEEREIIFSYKEKTYNFEISEDLINIYQIFDDKDGIEIYSIKYSKQNYFEQVNQILEKPLFDGKTLFEIEKDINVISNS